ncbi:uncharacterized protein LOC134216976 [Armigeres subalbatus]|uniref:uncharacterized protein LOC134216976 n=1 Tax=Armigeres subalbatus TaxID=124917 RepID=UPI002ED579D3
MSSVNSPNSILSETRSLSQRMRSAYDVSQNTATIGDVAAALEALRNNLSSLIEQAKIRIHKASVNQTTPLTEKQAKMLNDAIYSACSILRKHEQLTNAQNRKRLDQNDTTATPGRVSGEEFQEQMANLSKQLNAVSIEMAKLKRANDNIMNIYSNYMLENEEECDSDEEDDDSDSNEENNTMYKRD